MDAADLGPSFAADDHRDFLRLVLDHISDCLVVVDRDGQVTFINQPYCDLLGARAEAVIGHHVTEVITPQTKLHQVACGKMPWVCEPLTVRGHKLITKQYPIRRGGRIVGAFGMALFTDPDQVVALARKVRSASVDLGRHGRHWRARYGIDDLVGDDPALEDLRTRIRKLAPLERPVLIEGETGTGKELVAHALHTESPRHGEPFVWVNCAAVPGELIESELFGYEGGAFTGASSKGSLGKFELADGGTLFLDEAGEMPPALQSTLLRVVQDGEVVRVGGSRPIPLDVRLVVATHRSLDEEVRSGRFRRDLYYRLAVARLRTPALRERSDRRALAHTLFGQICRELGRHDLSLGEEALQQIEREAWPGNVRELRNALERTVIEAEADRELGRILSDGQLTGAGRDPTGAEPPAASALDHRVADSERAAIEEALATTGGNKARAARLLGIDRSTLYRKLGRNGAPRRAS